MAKWAQNFSWSKGILEVASAYQKSAELAVMPSPWLCNIPPGVGVHWEFLGLVRRCTGTGEIRHRLAQLAKIRIGNLIR